MGIELIKSYIIHMYEVYFVLLIGNGYRDLDTIAGNCLR